MRELFWHWPSVLSPADINRILEIGSHQTAEAARVFSASETVQGVRSCSVRWLQDEWLLGLLWPFVEEANQRGFHVEVERRAEVQIVEYRSTHCDHYGWHHDVNWNGQEARDRKLSVTVQLSDSDAYTGGDFEFEEVGTTADFRSLGTVLVFPSYLRHRVHPVSGGVRRSLVAWFHGPRWQ